jgi:hypothetical protein
MGWACLWVRDTINAYRILIRKYFGELAEKMGGQHEDMFY